MSTTVKNVCDLKFFDPEYQENAGITERSENSQKSSERNKKKHSSFKQEENEDADNSVDYYGGVEFYKAKSLEDQIIIKKLEDELKKLEFDNIELIKEKNNLITRMKKGNFGRSENITDYSDELMMIVSDIQIELIANDLSSSEIKAIQDKNFKINNKNNKAKKEVYLELIQQKKIQKFIKQRVIKFPIEATKRRRSNEGFELEIESEISLNIIAKVNPNKVVKKGFKNNMCEQEQEEPKQYKNQDKSSGKPNDRADNSEKEKYYSEDQRKG